MHGVEPGRGSAAVQECVMPFVVSGGHRLEYAWYGSADGGEPPIVMLHEGLGSLALWRDFPQRLADAAGRRALVYSRVGYGAADPRGWPAGGRFLANQSPDAR